MTDNFDWRDMLFCIEKQKSQMAKKSQAHKFASFEDLIYIARDQTTSSQTV